MGPTARLRRFLGPKELDMALRGLGFVSILVLSLLPLVPAAVTFTVNSTADTSDASPGDGVCDAGGGVCTLRAAIEEANALAGADTIQFAVGSGPQTITFGSSLPVIMETVTVDGTTQPGYSGTPLITLDGGTPFGIGVPANGTILRGIAFDHSVGSAIGLNSSNSTIESCSILHASGHGIEVVGGSDNIIRNNTIAFSGLDGVRINENMNFSFPLFTALTPDQTHTTQTIDYTDDCSNFHHVNDNSPIIDNAGHAFNENFGARFTATMSIPMPGSYHFAFTNLDDLGRLVIDSTEYINGNG